MGVGRLSVRGPKMNNMPRASAIAVLQAEGGRVLFLFRTCADRLVDDSTCSDIANDKDCNPLDNTFSGAPLRTALKCYR
jgi:hypothetical protein